MEVDATGDANGFEAPVPFTTGGCAAVERRSTGGIGKGRRENGFNDCAAVVVVVMELCCTAGGGLAFGREEE